MSRGVAASARRPTVAARRHELEAAVAAALELLDAMDGDADLEPSCDDEGFDADREPDGDAEPDRDGEGTLDPVWSIGDRDMWEVHGCTADPLLDPDEVPADFATPRLLVSVRV